MAAPYNYLLFSKGRAGGSPVHTFNCAARPYTLAKTRFASN